jgi:hypothetical protein
MSTEFIFRPPAWDNLLLPLFQSIHLDRIVFKNSVRTAKKTQLIPITKNKWFLPSKEIIALHSEKHTEIIREPYGQNAELLETKEVAGTGIRFFIWLLQQL